MDRHQGLDLGLVVGEAGIDDVVVACQPLVGGVEGIELVAQEEEAHLVERVVVAASMVSEARIVCRGSRH